MLTCCTCAVEAATCNSVLCYCQLRAMNVRKNSVWLVSAVVGNPQVVCLLSAADLELKVQFQAACGGIHRSRCKDLSSRSCCSMQTAKLRREKKGSPFPIYSILLSPPAFFPQAEDYSIFIPFRYSIIILFTF